MTTFLDGPAEGKTLLLKRAPHFLRAVQSRDDEWDALDQLDDKPAPGETIIAYEMVGEPTWCHINAKRGGGMFRGGRYRVIVDQPTDEILRSTVRWREWCSTRIGKSIAADGTVQESQP